MTILEASGQSGFQKLSEGFLGLWEEENQVVSRIRRIMDSKKIGNSIKLKTKLEVCFLSLLMMGSIIHFQVKAETQPISAPDNIIVVNEEPYNIIEKSDNTSENIQIDDQAVQEQELVSFSLEVFPCEAYRIAFPIWYESNPDAIKNELMFYANPGTDVQTVSDEVVIETGRIPFYGKYVITENNNYQMRYSHLQEITANVGDELEKGSTIGTVGSTGAVKHYMCELRVLLKDGNPVDLSAYGNGYEW